MDNAMFSGLTKQYFCSDAILQQQGKYSNRLSRAEVSRTTERYSYDAQKNVVSMAGFSVE